MVAMKNMRLLMNREARLWWHNIDERIAWDTTIWHRPAKEQLDCCRLDTGLPQPKLVLLNNIGGRQSHHQHNYARRWTQIGQLFALLESYSQRLTSFVL